MTKPVVKIITLANNRKAILNQISGKALEEAVLAGGHVVEAYAKINANEVFSHKATGSAGLTGSIQTVVASAHGTKVEVDVGPTVIYGRIRELGGTIRPVFKRWLRWMNDAGEYVFAKVSVQVPRPYLRPAVDEHEEEISRAIGSALERGIRKVARD